MNSSRKHMGLQGGARFAAHWKCAAKPTSDLQPPTSNSRSAFTMIELLVVVSVILVLMAAFTLVLGSLLQNARIRATQATITKINGMVQQRAEAFERQLEKSNVLQTEKTKTRTFLVGAYSVYTNYPPVQAWTIDNASDRVWEVLTRARKFRETFPQSFVEICGFDRAPGVLGTDDDMNGTKDWTTSASGAQIPDLGELGYSAPGTPQAAYYPDDALPFVKALQALAPQLNLSKHTLETESSELLYLALTATESFGVPAVGSDEFSSSEVRDTDGDGLLEFVDAWGRPLRFYRWPTRLIRFGETAFTGDTNGNGTVDNAGPGFSLGGKNVGATVDPRYANLLIETLPALQPGSVALMRDPNDGFGILTKIVTGSAVTSPTAMQYALNFEYWFYTQDTYSTFLIVSAGPDALLGLYEPNNVALPVPPTLATIMGHLAQPNADGLGTGSDPLSTSALTDNISNRRR